MRCRLRALQMTGGKNQCDTSHCWNWCVKHCLRLQCRKCRCWESSAVGACAALRSLRCFCTMDLGNACQSCSEDDNNNEGWSVSVSQNSWPRQTPTPQQNRPPCKSSSLRFWKFREIIACSTLELLQFPPMYSLLSAMSYVVSPRK
jgi:hypothetical protein